MGSRVGFDSRCSARGLHYASGGHPSSRPW
uniref:Uncharacterized protein n=1 Tax=Vitis vinifera TaxID=29760 RepID=F6I2V1_VITVI